MPTYQSISRPTTTYESVGTVLWSENVLPWIIAYLPWSIGTSHIPTYSTINATSLLQSPRIDRCNTQINTTIGTINGYKINIYDEIAKPL